MSDLTITNAGVSVAANSAGSSISTGKRKVIRVTPTLDTSAYGAGDVMFETTEIPNAVREDGGCSKLIGITILNEDNAANDMDLVFMQVNKDLGTVNDAVGSGSLWTNPLAKAAKPLGWVSVDWSEGDLNLVNNQLWSSIRTGGAGVGEMNNTMLLQAENNSTSVYFSAISRGTPTTAADDYEFIFHIEY